MWWKKRKKIKSTEDALLDIDLISSSENYNSQSENKTFQKLDENLLSQLHDNKVAMEELYILLTEVKHMLKGNIKGK